jgi:hypothetical protein
MITHSARITRLQARIKFELRQKRRRGERWRSMLQETPAVNKPDNEVKINMSLCTHRRHVV